MSFTQDDGGCRVAAACNPVKARRKSKIKQNSRQSLVNAQIQYSLPMFLHFINNPDYLSNVEKVDSQGNMCNTHFYQFGFFIYISK